MKNPKRNKRKKRNKRNRTKDLSLGISTTWSRKVAKSRSKKKGFVCIHWMGRCICKWNGISVEHVVCKTAWACARHALRSVIVDPNVILSIVECQEVLTVIVILCQLVSSTIRTLWEIRGSKYRYTNAERRWMLIRLDWLKSIKYRWSRFTKQ